VGQSGLSAGHRSPKTIWCKRWLRHPEGTRLAVPKEIVNLVRRFEGNHKEYMSANYNEAQTRQEFINLLFKALGWDMYNDQGLSDTCKEVLHEPSLNAGSTTISPDYAFKLGGSTKFLVEAKKPSVNIRWSTNPQYQIRTYAWKANLPISILTNFEEFAVYDCRSLPKKDDTIDIPLICYLRYTDYPTCWDWIYSKFSKTAVQEGCLDRILQGNKEGKNTKEYDEAFLKEISKWKEELNQYQPNIIVDEPGKQPTDPQEVDIREHAVLIKINQLYRYEMDADSLYDTTRGVWVIGGRNDGGRRDCPDYAFSVFRGIIIEVYKIKHWYRAGTHATFYKTRPDCNELWTSEPQKWEFEGEIAESEIREKYLNKSVKKNYRSYGSPIKYVNC